MDLLRILEEMVDASFHTSVQVSTKGGRYSPVFSNVTKTTQFGSPVAQVYLAAYACSASLLG